MPRPYPIPAPGVVGIGNPADVLRFVDKQRRQMRPVKRDFELEPLNSL